MASLMFTDCSTCTTSRLIHSNRPDVTLLPRRCVGQLYLRTSTRSGHGCIRSSSDHAAVVMNGSDVSIKILREITHETWRMKKSIGVVPGLAVILVGDRKDSNAYALPCKIVGIKPFIARLAEDSSEEEVLKCISRFNNDPCIHGILVHKPHLPSRMDEQTIVNAISVEKDVDGFHPINIGRLAMRGREPFLVPRAPKGCIELLHRYNVEIKGKRAVVLGRSSVFGMPAALLLEREDATVTIIHSRTKNPEEITRQADIVISAVGKPNLVRGSWVKPGAVVINVGYSFVADPLGPLGRLGFRVVGDICYDEVCKVASAITPDGQSVAAGMNSVMLLSNTLTSAKRVHNFM